MRTLISKPLILTDAVKAKILKWSLDYNEVAWLDSNNYDQAHASFQALLAADAMTSIVTDADTAFSKLEEYQSTTKDWLFGYLSYDLKNDVERLHSNNYDGLGFPEMFFFQPKKLIFFKDDRVEFHYLKFIEDEIAKDYAYFSSKMETIEEKTLLSNIKIKLRTSKDSYTSKVNKLLKHIERGDIYEANFCQEFYSENNEIDVLSTFLRLNKISKSPFATFLKLDHRYLLSASPERYMRKSGTDIISQPIKGTAKRDKNPKIDNAIKENLKADPKERSENIMIADLVRNDLSRIAVKCSVEVEELCHVYTFEQVHQLITTIRCKVSDSVSPASILRHTFPMGSMTGAPKISAMEIIEELEDTKRGLYSGSVGYFSPNNDFDFNVVIRSILYNADTKYVSFSVGGAITAKSVIEKEYEECLLKAKAMREALDS